MKLLICLSLLAATAPSSTAFARDVWEVENVVSVWGQHPSHTVRFENNSWQDYRKPILTGGQPDAQLQGSVEGTHMVTTQWGNYVHNLRRPDGSWTGWTSIPIEASSGYEEEFYDLSISNVLDANGQNTLHVCSIDDSGWSGIGGFQHAIRYADGTWRSMRQETLVARPRYVACVGMGSTLHVLIVDWYGALWESKLINGTFSPARHVADGFGQIAATPLFGFVRVLGISNGNLVTTQASADPVWPTFVLQTGNFSDVSATALNHYLHVSLATASGDVLHGVRIPNGQWSTFSSIKPMTGDPGSVRTTSISTALHSYP